MTRLRIAQIAAEIAPFAKSGGLADAVAGLSRSLARAGHDVRLFMPLYRSAEGTLRDAPALVQRFEMTLEFGGRVLPVRIATARLPDSGADVHFVDCPEAYARAQMYSLDHPDEDVRFALLCRAVLETCQRLQWAPDILHCNDWHTALLPLYLRTIYAWDRLFAPTRTLLTIHNIAFQGQFGPSAIDAVGLGAQREHFHQEDLARGAVNFLKTGLLYADHISTVSASYAREICTDEHGMGLAPLLRERSGSLTGIVNGVDYGSWDPASDPLLPARYSAADLRGKAVCRRALLERFDLTPAPSGPVFGSVSRLTRQKGIDLLLEVMPVVLREHDVRFCAVGSGEHHWEQGLEQLCDAFPDRVGIHKGYHEELAHWIEAGSDVFLMPSLFEPCGLNQMYSLRYGTVPIVRRTGGLADTVEPFDPERGTGTGFVFEAYDADAMLEAVRTALRTWQDRSAWQRLVANGMAQDFGWDRQAAHYVALYRGMLGSD